MTKINALSTILSACTHAGCEKCTHLDTTTDHLAAAKAKVDKRLSA